MAPEPAAESAATTRTGQSACAIGCRHLFSLLQLVCRLEAYDTDLHPTDRQEVNAARGGIFK
jgi:hypothetical protein